MKIVPKIGLCCVLSPIEENADSAPDIFEKALRKLKANDKFEIMIANEFVKDIATARSVGKQFKKEEVDVVCVKLVTWSSDELVLDMNAECEVPFVFWAYSNITAGSLCGAQQFNMVFKELNKQCAFVYNDDESALEKIEVYSKCVALKNKLKKAKFGIVGNRTQGMAEVIYDEFSIKEVFGARIRSVNIDTLKCIVNEFTDASGRTIWQEIKNKAGKVSVSDPEGIRSVNTYLALKKIIKQEKLDGIAIECYPNFMGEVCLAFSMLADEGIPGACEGDINSAILMYMLMMFSEQAIHDIDPLFLFEEDNSLLGSHCGSGSFALANSKEQIELAKVRLANKGLCVLFPSKPGKVTLANLVGRKGTFRLSVLVGEATETGMAFPGNPIKIKLPIPIETFLEVVEEYALGHHWIVAYGDYEAYLRRIALLLGIDFVNF